MVGADAFGKGLSRREIRSVYLPVLSAGQTPAEKYADILDEVRVADELGWDVAWFAEHHSDVYGGIVPSIAVMGAAVAMQTRSHPRRLGGHHPPPAQRPASGRRVRHAGRAQPGARRAGDRAGLHAPRVPRLRRGLRQRARASSVRRSRRCSRPGPATGQLPAHSPPPGCTRIPTAAGAPPADLDGRRAQPGELPDRRSPGLQPDGQSLHPHAGGSEPAASPGTRRRTRLPGTTSPDGASSSTSICTWPPPRPRRGKSPARH